jgi:hypothetical protein
MTDRPLRSKIPPTPEGATPQGVAFTEHPLPKEPATDLKLVLEDGKTLRERFTLRPAGARGVVGPSNAANTEFNLLISLAALDENDNVRRDADGAPLIAPAHEVLISLETAGRLGSADALEAEVKKAREVAAAYASRAFQGADALAEFFARRPTADGAARV